MKKMLFVLLAMAVIFASCSNSAGGAATGGLDGGTPTGGTPVGAGGDPTTNAPVLIGASNLMYIGEGQETVDSTAYTVKKYADVMVDNPYFYTYYKLYYLNGKLRRVYQFEHGIGCAMDYKYTEFVEHHCNCNTNGRNAITIYTYYENGKAESRIINTPVAGNTQVTQQKDLYEYYPAGNIKSQKTYFNNTTLYSENYYYSNGAIKLTAFNPAVMYNSMGELNFVYYYESGFVKYYLNYYSGSTYKFYTFADNTCQTSPNPGSATSTETYTLDQGKAKLAELKNN